MEGVYQHVYNAHDVAEPEYDPGNDEERKGEIEMKIKRRREKERPTWKIGRRLPARL